MHRHLRAALADEPDVDATFYDVPHRGLLRRVVGVSVPGLSRLDLDLKAIRGLVVQNARVRRHLHHLSPTPDVLHIYTQNAALFSVATMRRIPTVISTDVTNRLNFYRLPHRRPTRFTSLSVSAIAGPERRVYEAARRVVTHSNWAADSVVGYGIPASRVEVIPFGITIPPEVPARVTEGLPRILFVGRSMDRKGGWRLLDLWRRQLASVSRLVLVTPERVPAEPGLEVRNDVRPGDGKLEEILASADVFAFPSEIDPFGYAILEAMAASLPVVGFAQAAVPEMVADGTSGIIVPPDDDVAFVAALRRFVDDPDARREMGAAGRHVLVERFDTRSTTAQLLEVLRAAAG